MAEHISEEEQTNCPICDDQFQIGDLCALDIELGMCHADCLKGSPVVDLDTAKEISGDIGTFRYGKDA